MALYDEPCNRQLFMDRLGAENISGTRSLMIHLDSVNHQMETFLRGKRMLKYLPAPTKKDRFQDKLNFIGKYASKLFSYRPMDFQRSRMSFARYVSGIVQKVLQTRHIVFHYRNALSRQRFRTQRHDYIIRLEHLLEMEKHHSKK